MIGSLEAIYRDLLTRIHAGRLLAPFLAFEVGSRRVHVLGAGKASAAMAAAVVARYPVVGGVVVAKEPFDGALGPLELRLGDHPIPGLRSLAAGEAMLRYVQGIEPEDLTIFCLSGGASALLEALAPGVTLDDVREVTAGLLRGGVPIQAMNAVRRRLSLLKGGGLGARVPGEVCVFVLSDVLGNDLRAIGSGPFVGGAVGDPESVLRSNGLDRFVQLLLPELNDVGVAKHVIVGDAETLRHAAAAAVRAAGAMPRVFGSPLTGEARSAASRVLSEGASLAVGEVGVWVGEPTVTVRGSGLGGRAQELALAASLEMPVGLELLAAGTDGTDGPTPVAGAVVRASSDRDGALAALESNDSYGYLTSLGACLRTGPTNSNLGDVVLVRR